MSLDSLRQLRRQGEKPDSIVKVVIGRRHPVFEGAPDVVTVAAPDQPMFMDWRPVVGLPVAIFVCDDCSDLGERVFDAIKAAGGKFLGVVWRDTALAPEPAQPVLNKMWRTLCTS